MTKKKLHKTELVPASIMAIQATPVDLSYFDLMCQVFQLDPNEDFNATQKMRVWYRPCHKELRIF